MNHHHLRLFLSVLEHGSMSAAAHEFGMTHSAFSKQIGRLEASFGIPLLERLPRGIRPTAAGRLLAGHARAVAASYHSTVRHIDSVAKSQTGELTVGAGYYWLNGLLPQAITKLVEDYPGARVKIVSGLPGNLTKQLLDGALDLVFGPVAFRDGHTDKIEAESLMRTDSAVLVRKGHTFDDGQKYSIEDLALLKWVMLNGTVIRKSFDMLFEANGIKPPEPTVEVDNAVTALELVAGSEMATLAGSVTPLGTPWKDLVQVKCPDLVSWRDGGILRRKYEMLPELGEHLCDQVRKLAKSHIHAIV